jgi:hypothetical protein
MGEMIERCEAAINRLQDTGEVVGVKDVVKAVLKEMHEPTPEMHEAGTARDDGGDRTNALGVYQAMIDDALCSSQVEQP